MRYRRKITAVFLAGGTGAGRGRPGGKRNTQTRKRGASLQRGGQPHIHISKPSKSLDPAHAV